eukprot:1340725-Amorphochlora_amoeboformis.AAC.2
MDKRCDPCCGSRGRCLKTNGISNIFRPKALPLFSSLYQNFKEVWDAEAVFWVLCSDISGRCYFGSTVEMKSLRLSESKARVVSVES